MYVTGTFDNWSKSEKLEKVGDHFEKTVTLPETSESIFYKVRYFSWPFTTSKPLSLARVSGAANTPMRGQPGAWEPHAAVLQRTKRRGPLRGGQPELWLSL